MQDAEVPVPPAATALTTERTPLLGAGPDSGPRADGNGDVENGSPPTPRGTAGSGDGDAAQGVEQVEGNPEMRKKMHLFVPAVGIGVFLVAVDQLLITATYARIGSELNALSYTNWIATAYLLTLTSFQPLYGKLSDIFGRKECLLFAYAIFTIGCLGCGLAQDIVQLCVARAISGMGGGGMTSLVSILMSDIVPLRERGVWQGYLNIIFAAGTTTGAPLGGLLADSLGWRWSFIAQVPLCLAAWVAVYFVLKMPPMSHEHWLTKLRNIDFLGAFTLILAVIALLVGLDAGSNHGWSHLLTIIPLAACVPLFCLFLFTEIKIASHPFAPGHIIFEKSMFAAYLANFFGCAGHLGIIFYAPLYFQAVMGANATKSGALLMPGLISSVAASLGAGIVLKRTGKFYWITVFSFAVLLLSVVPLVLSINYKFILGSEIGLVLCSFGLGSGVTTSLIGLLANAAASDSAVVIACSYLFRSLGSSIGISISSAVLQQTLRQQLALRFSDGDQAREIEQRVRQSLDYIEELPPQLAEQVRLSYKMASMAAYIPVAIFLVLAFLVTFWIKEKPLKR